MEVSRAISPVAFPVFSKLQDDPDALDDALAKTVRLLTLVSFPAAVGMVFTARPFVEGVLGTEWLPIIPVMQLVAVYGAFSALTSVFIDIWNAVGRPDLNTKVNALRLIVTGVLIYPATTTYGIEGTVAVMAGVFILLTVPIKIHLTTTLIETSHRHVLRQMAYPAVASGLMGGALLLLRHVLPVRSAVLEFVSLVLVGVGVYLAAIVGINARSDWAIGRDFETVLDVVRD
jgi:PST family polysaccharide transporter/lipopolysaccharide exporter